MPATTPVTPRLRSRLSRSSESSSSSPAAQNRIVKKLVLRGHAFGRGARYDLFLLVTTPAIAHAASYPLLPDADVKLLSSSVDGLSPTGGYAPLSETAARAARHLGGRVSVDAFDVASQPRITIFNYAITLNVAPASVNRPSTSTSPPPAQPTSWMVHLELETRFKTEPPRSPWALHLPVPRCLHSRVHFTFAPEVVDADDDIDVRVEPPLGKRRPPKPRRSFGGGGDASADDDAQSMITQSDEAADEGEDDHSLCVKGLFQSTDRLSIRWASTSAGKLHLDDSLAAIRCDDMRLETTSRYTLHQDGRVRVDVLCRGNLRGTFCPGLDHLVYLPLILDSSGQETEYQDMTVEDVAGLRSWHFLSPGDVPHKHPQRSGSNSTLASLASNSSLDESTMLDGDDLLATRPPRGFDASLDLSAELTANNGNGARSAPPLGPDEQSRVIMYLDLLEATDVFSFTLRYRLLAELDASGSVALPTMTAPTAAQLTIMQHLEPHVEPPPSDLGVLKPARTKQTPSRDEPDVLSVEHKGFAASAPHLHLIRPLRDDDSGDDAALDADAEVGADSTLQAAEESLVAASPPRTPQAVHRPMPVWNDSMVLHDDDSHRPSVIAEAKLAVWLCSRSDDKAPVGLRRVVTDLRCTWPLVKKDGRPLEEMDIWLPRIASDAGKSWGFGERVREPVVRLALVGGIPVEPYRSDAAENLCLHLRPPTPTVTSPLTAEMRLIFEYEALTPTPTPSAPSLQSAALSLPLPFFASELLLLHVQVQHDGIAVANVAAPSFDMQGPAKGSQASIGDGELVTELHRFVVPPLTPLDVTALMVPANEAVRRRKRRHYDPRRQETGRRRFLLGLRPGAEDDGDKSASRRWLSTIALLVAGLCILLASSAAINEPFGDGVRAASHDLVSAQRHTASRSRIKPGWSDFEAINRRVEQLAMAANVDFGDGTWNADKEARREGAVEGAEDENQGLSSIPSWPRPPPSSADVENVQVYDDDFDQRGASPPPTTSLSRRPAQPSLTMVASAVLRVLCSPLVAVGRGAAVLLGLVARGGGAR